MNTLEATSKMTEQKTKPVEGLTNSKNLGRIFGAVGVVTLISTPLTYLLTAEFGPLVWGKLLVGSVLVGVYLFTNADFFSRVAGTRSTGLLAISSLTVLLVAGFVGVLNYLSFKNPKEWDLTKEGIYTLSEQTKGLLGRLKTDVKVFAFYNNIEPQYSEIEETLKRYHKHGTKLSFEMVDPQSRPDLVEKYKITEWGPRIVLTSGDQDARAKDGSEQELTNAIIKVAEQTAKTVYFLTGHGEGDIAQESESTGYKAIADAVIAEGYQTKPLSLLQAAAAAPGAEIKLEQAKDEKKAAGAGDVLQVPSDAGVVVVAGPRSKLFEPEVAALEKYLNQGGRMIVLLEPDIETGLEGLLKQWKVELQKDLIVDTNPLNRLLGLGPAAPMVQPTEQEHTITKDMKAPVVMMTSRSLTVAQGGESGVQTRAFLEAGSSSWGETNYKGGTASLDEGDHKGPLSVALAAEKHLSDEATNKISDEARLVVFGDADWIDNRYMQMQGNSDVFLNTVNWLAEQEGKITIRPKNRTASQLFLSGEELGKLKFFSMDILPVLLIAMGLGIVLIRRQR